MSSKAWLARAMGPWLLLLCTAANPPPAPAPDLGQALAAARHTLVLSGDGFSGDGGALLRQAVGDARYVAVGEDHFTREIPRFASALCRLMGPQGLAAYVVEAGPVATQAIEATLGAPDREARVAAFARAYPNAVAFLDDADENRAAAACRGAGAGPVRLIGIDQEFFGGSGLLIDEILKTKLSPAARRAVLALREEERRDAAAAAQSGDPAQLLMLKADAVALTRVDDILHREGNPQARRIFEELTSSRAIYMLNAAGSPDANAVRARRMKRRLADWLPARGKVLLKFGDWHLYKGINPLEQLDIGNFISERADGEGARSLHILVLPVGGTHGAFAGYGRQVNAAAFTMSEDKDYRWFALAAQNQATDGWTLFDLRTLRHRRITGVDADWRRVIDGYDLLVVVPAASAAKLLAYPG